MCDVVDASTSGPVLDLLEGPSCLRVLEVGEYHIVFHDDQARVAKMTVATEGTPMSVRRPSILLGCLLMDRCTWLQARPRANTGSG